MKLCHICLCPQRGSDLINTAKLIQVSASDFLLARFASLFLLTVTRLPKPAKIIAKV